MDHYIMNYPQLGEISRTCALLYFFIPYLSINEVVHVVHIPFPR